MTSDAKHVEIGLTDKSDSARWYFAHLWRRGIWPEQVLIVGDELGALGGLPGSDSRLLIDGAAGASVVSVGVEPAGVPAGVVALGGGPARFLRLLGAPASAAPRRAPCRSSLRTRAGRCGCEGVDHERERACESMLTLADGLLGTRGSMLTAVPGIHTARRDGRRLRRARRAL